MDEAFVFNWTIERFSWCQVPTGEPICSPVFVADTPYQTHWRLKLYPKGLLDPQYISCYLECHKYNEPRERAVDFDIGILNDKDALACSSEMKNVVFSNCNALGFRKLIAWDFLQSHSQELLPKDTLRIQCRLKAAPTVLPQYADLDALSQTFKKLFAFGYFNDLGLQGKEIVLPVHADIVCARAPKYGKKLRLKLARMKRRGDNGYKIRVGEDIGALGHFLLYLYCGVVETSDPLVWDQLYGLAESYELYDMKRDICPTPTVSSVRTRVMTLTKTVIFTIEHFTTTMESCMGRFLDFGFARVTVEYYANDDLPDSHRIGLIIWCFTSDLWCTDQLFCTVSVIDVNGESHFTSVHEILHDDNITAKGLPSVICKKELMNDLFLSSDDTIRLKFSFTAISGLEPTMIGAQKAGRALCLGHEAPPRLTLSRLSKDFEQLVARNTIESIDPDWMKFDAGGLQKAIFSAWSLEHKKVFGSSNKRKQPSIYSNTATEMCALVYRFLCTGTITIPSLQASIILCSVATKYKISSLKKICLEHLKSNITIGNAALALVWAHGHEDYCYTTIEDFVCNNFDRIAITNDWKYLTMGYPFIADSITCRLRDRGQTSGEQNLNFISADMILE